MLEDRWTNSKTNTVLGVTGPLGSPRAWLRRAFDAVSLDDTAFQPGALTPYEISVGAVWYRPVVLPDQGCHRVLYRFFDISNPEDLQRNIKRTHLLPAIGIAAAVPMNEIMAWIAQAKNSGAAYTWWKKPEDKSVRVVSNRPVRRQVDHTKIYKLLDAGVSKAEIAQRLDYPVHNIDYVFKKWEQSIPLKDRPAWAIRNDMIEDYRAGMTMPELVQKHKKSPAYIYKIVKSAT
jgi:hypothetical protein